MYEWWEALTGLQKIFYMIAVPATVLMLFQSILLLFGIGDGDGDVGLDLHGDIPDSDIDLGGDDGLALFSIRGIVAFFAVGGWTGVVMADRRWPAVVCIVVAFVAGALALLALAVVMRKVSRMQDSGNIQLENAIGKIAKVYLRIPAGNREPGKVTLTVQERYLECDAVTNEPTDLQTGETVVVTELIEPNLLVVERFPQK